jgi:small subunit ribosomal protein S18
MGRGNLREKTAKKSRSIDNRFQKKKGCFFCQGKYEWVDYKDVNLLRRFISDRGKIRSRRTTGCCNQHQRDVAQAIKNARELMLLPYIQKGSGDRFAKVLGKDQEVTPKSEYEEIISQYEKIYGEETEEESESLEELQQ